MALWARGEMRGAALPALPGAQRARQALPVPPFPALGAGSAVGARQAPAPYGGEPALKPAVAHHRRVLVLATPLTLREEKFVALMHQCAGCAEIVPLPCPELVEFVERGELDSPALTAYLARQLGPYAGRVDAAVLGCTHFPFARRAIRAALGGNVTLYDGSDGTARETLRQLVRRGWVRGGSHGAVTLENSLPSELPLSRRLLALPRED